MLFLLFLCVCVVSLWDSTIAKVYPCTKLVQASKRHARESKVTGCHRTLFITLLVILGHSSLQKCWHHENVNVNRDASNLVGCLIKSRVTCNLENVFSINGEKTWNWSFCAPEGSQASLKRHKKNNQRRETMMGGLNSLHCANWNFFFFYLLLSRGSFNTSPPKAHNSDSQQHCVGGGRDPEAWRICSPADVARRLLFR